MTSYIPMALRCESHISLGVVVGVSIW